MKNVILIGTLLLFVGCSALGESNVTGSKVTVKKGDVTISAEIQTDKPGESDKDKTE